MRLNCSKSSLINGVNIVMKAVPSNTTISILNCILIDATDGIIKFTSNDGDLGIETIVDGVIEEKGSIAIDAKTFSDIVRALPDTDIIIDADKNNNIKVIYGKSKFEIKGEPGDNFTSLPEIEKNEAIVLSQLTLKDIIRQTIFSIGAGEANKIMNGIHFFINGDKLKCSSLDGHRISIRFTKLKESYSVNEAIVPGKTLNEISKIISGGAEDDISLYLSNNFILFEFDNTKVVSRLIDGVYFDVNKMISPNYETKISINKKEFLDCLSRSMLFSKEGNKKPVVIEIGNENLRIYVNSPLGSMDEEVPIMIEGKTLEIGFNPKFLADAVKAIDDETIDIYFVNSKAPCYIKDEGENYIYLVLPINLNRG